MHAADAPPIKTAATRAKNCNFMRQLLKGGDVPVLQKGRGGLGQDKPWQPQQRYHRRGTLQASPPLQDEILNTP